MSAIAKPPIAALVTEGAKLVSELMALKEKADRLDVIKEALREAAAGKDSTFTGEHGEIAEVKYVRDGIARSIRGKDIARVIKLAGDKLFSFFQLAPLPAKELPEKDFRVAVLTGLPKAQAIRLLDALTVPTTPRVSFSS